MLILIVKCEAIKCFKCNSAYDPECLNLSTSWSNKFITDCDKFHHQHFKNLSSTFCTKLYQKGKFWIL